MRTVEIEVFDYAELSDNAKETAFEQWDEETSHWGYSWSDEVDKIIERIQSETPIKCEDLNYDTQSFNYSLGVIGYHGKDDDKYHMTGLRAAKLTLSMYYNITHEQQFFGRSIERYGKVSFKYYDKDYLSLTTKSRRSAFFTNDQCFTGYCDSATFAEGLWDSIRTNTKHDYTVLDHFKAAFDRMFKSVVSDYRAIQSQEYFEENEAHNYEYTEDGKRYTSSDLCE